MRAERINFRSHFMLPPVQRRAFSEALKLLYTSSCCNLNNPTGYSKVLKYILAINFQYYMILCECSSALLQRCYFSLSQNKNKKRLQSTFSHSPLHLGGQSKDRGERGSKIPLSFGACMQMCTLRYYSLCTRLQHHKSQ
jgi:hypothetical protein